MKIFVTGGIGSGKSTFTQRMADHGAAVVFADRVGHENLFDPAVKDALVQQFGADILDEAGEINRGALAAKAFASPEATQALDAITQPVLYQRCLEQIESLEKDYDVVVLEMAILDGRDDFGDNADMVVCVTASPEVRVERLVQSRGIPVDDARNRLARQVPESQRIAISDVVLVNDTTVEDFYRDIDVWVSKLHLFDGAQNPCN